MSIDYLVLFIVAVLCGLTVKKFDECIMQRKAEKARAANKAAYQKEVDLLPFEPTEEDKQAFTEDESKAVLDSMPYGYEWE